MLTLVVSWILLLAVCGTVGLGAMQVARVSVDEPADRWIVGAWVGLALVGAVLLLASVFIALSPGAVAAMSTVLVVASITSAGVRSEWNDLSRRARRRVLPGGVLLLALAGLFARPVTLYDSGAYHVGIIEWLSRFGSVPGVALIHARLSFGSSWFALDTAFNHGFLHGRTAGMLGGLAVLLGLVHLAVAAARSVGRRARASDLFLLAGLGVVVLSLSSDLMISPSPDVPTAFLLVEAAWLVFKAFEATSAERRQASMTGALILASGAAGMKLSALPLALMVFTLSVFLRFSARRVAALALLAMVFAGPTLTSNTVTSGCPLFPSGPCLDANWALSTHERDDVRTDILDFGRGTLETPIQERSPFNWIWQEWLFGGGGARTTILLLVAASALLAGTWFALRRTSWFTPALIALLAGAVAVSILSRRLPNILTSLALLLALLAAWKARDPGARIVALMGLVGLGFVLYQGPLFRFGLGYVAISVAAAAAVGLGRLGVPESFPSLPSAPSSARWRRLLLAAGLLVVAISVVYVPGFGRGFAANGGTERVFVPPEVPEPRVERHEARDFFYDVSLSNAQCWATDLPCAQYPLPDDRRLRDPDEGIGSGFERAG